MRNPLETERNLNPIIPTEKPGFTNILAGVRNATYEARNIATVAAALPLAAVLYSVTMARNGDNESAGEEKKRKSAGASQRRFFRGAKDAPDSKKDNDPKLANSDMEEIPHNTCSGSGKIDGKNCDGCGGTGSIWRKRR